MCVPAPPGVFEPVTLTRCLFTGSPRCLFTGTEQYTHRDLTKPVSAFHPRAAKSLIAFSSRCCSFSCTGSRSNSPGYPVMVSSRRRPSRPRIVSLSRVLRGTCAHQDQSRQDNARAAYRSLSQSMPIQRISLPRSYSELVIIHLHLQRRNSHVQMRFTMSGKAMHPHHSLD